MRKISLRSVFFVMFMAVYFILVLRRTRNHRSLKRSLLLKKMPSKRLKEISKRYNINNFKNPIVR